MGEHGGRQRFETVFKVLTLVVAICLGIAQIAIMREQTRISAQQLQLIESTSMLAQMPAPSVHFDNTDSTLVLTNMGTHPFFVIETDLPWDQPHIYKPLPVPPQREMRFPVERGIADWRATGSVGAGFQGGFVLLSPSGERYLVESALHRIETGAPDAYAAEFLWVVSEREFLAEKRNLASSARR